MVPEDVPTTRAAVLQELQRHDQHGHEQVGHGQVDDVVVGDGVHVGVAPDGEDDQGVAAHGQHDDDEVGRRQNRQHPRQLRHVRVLRLVLDVARVKVRQGQGRGGGSGSGGDGGWGKRIVEGLVGSARRGGHPSLVVRMSPRAAGVVEVVEHAGTGSSLHGYGRLAAAAAAAAAESRRKCILLYISDGRELRCSKETALAKGFTFNVRNTKYPCVCRRTKLPVDSCLPVHSEKVRDIGRRWVGEE